MGGMTNAPFPTVTAQDASRLVAWARGSTRPVESADLPIEERKLTDRLVLARPYNDPGDRSAFAVVIAGQRILGEPWLVRAVLGRRAAGAPVMQRVAVEHLFDPTQEVAGAVIRRVQFASIRDEALTFLRQSAWSKKRLAEASPSLAGLFTSEVVEDANAAAIEAARGRRAPARTYTREHYRRIAEARLLLDASHRTGINAELCRVESERLGEPVALERMRTWLDTATKMGYLAPGKPGVRTREAGPELLGR